MFTLNFSQHMQWWCVLSAVWSPSLPHRTWYAPYGHRSSPSPPCKVNGGLHVGRWIRVNHDLKTPQMLVALCPPRFRWSKKFSHKSTRFRHILSLHLFLHLVSLLLCNQCTRNSLRRHYHCANPLIWLTDAYIYALFYWVLVKTVNFCRVRKGEGRINSTLRTNSYILSNA